MTSPKFSVVIPTREGGATLGATLTTCLDQEFDDYEVVVSDNFSSPATREVVERFASEKVRHFRTPESLSMSDNWEFALAQARGEYLTVLGDDDGLLPHALRELDRLTQTLPVRAIRWDAAFYLWPSIPLAGEANYLRIPLSREVRLLDGRPGIRSVIRLEKDYTSLPMLYNSVIHRSLVESLREQTGRVFRHSIPDVYSGFALAHLAGTFASVDVPMSVAGLSGKSTGVAVLFVREPSAVARDFHQLNRRAGFQPHPWVPDLKTLPVTVADTFLAAKQALFPDDSELSLDRKQLLSLCMQNLRADSEDDRDQQVRVIRATLEDNPELLAWFDATWREPVAPCSGPIRLRSERPGYDGNFLHLSADQYGVSDVAGAAKLCSRLLGYEGTPIEYGLKSHVRLEEEIGETHRRWREDSEALKRSLSQLRTAFEEYRESRFHRMADRVRDTLVRWRLLRSA